MEILEKIYDHSPAFLQNVFTSIYGYQLYKLRYGRLYQISLEKVEKVRLLNEEELVNLQLDSLKRLLYFCLDTIPYYKKVYKLNKLSISSINDLQNLPLLEKKCVRENFKEFLATKKTKVFLDHTSGTTGSPMNIAVDYQTVAYNYALVQNVRTAAMVSLQDKRATFGGRVVVPVNQIKPPFWRYNLAHKQLVFSSYHMSESNLSCYVKKLEKFAPAEINGYPSSIYLLAKYMARHGIKSIQPKAVFLNSEALLDFQKEMIEEQFHCKAYAWYGVAENVVFAGQCKEGNYHIAPEFGIVEIIKDEKPVRLGEDGEIVCTGLMNYAMPLIRYKTGDAGALLEKKCLCGSPLKALKFIAGRVEDYIITPDGRKVGRLDPVFKNIGNIAEAQIVQENIDSITVNIVKESKYSEKDAKKITDELQKRVGTKIKISLSYIKKIPRTSSGKFKFVISRIK
ncbi:MAG: phenylacetate--CoA ligase family protein [Candidatus Scalindua sp.]